jgi:hypothetical protein
LGRRCNDDSPGKQVAGLKQTHIFWDSFLWLIDHGTDILLNGQFYRLRKRANIFVSKDRPTQSTSKSELAVTVNGRDGIAIWRFLRGRLSM